MDDKRKARIEFLKNMIGYIPILLDAIPNLVKWHIAVKPGS